MSHRMRVDVARVVGLDDQQVALGELIARARRRMVRDGVGQVVRLRNEALVLAPDELLDRELARAPRPVGRHGMEREERLVLIEVEPAPEVAMELHDARRLQVHHVLRVRLGRHVADRLPLCSEER